MPFPDSQRVIYKRNPLEMVICQFRFPTVLRIDTELPVRFQELISREYPIFNERTQNELQLPPEVQQVARSLSQLNKREFEFVSEDGSWTVSLTSDFLALITNSYDRWETFQDHLKGPFDALMQIYPPLFFTRVGLRYRNGLKRSKLAIDNETAWSELLQPHIAGELASVSMGLEVIDRATNVLINLGNDSGRVTLRHGTGKDTTDNETVYVIDSDFHTEKRLKQDEIFSTLTDFNRNGRHLFKWCITDKLHNAMDPTPITD